MIRYCHSRKECVHFDKAHGMIFRENLEALVVKKRRGKFENPLKNSLEKSKYKTVIYK